MVGNFSNNGIDLFDPLGSDYGTRFQQGVPVLDRDLNLAEDLRRHQEEVLRRHYIGDGVPDVAGFAITAPSPPADHEVLIGVGRCCAAGLDVANRSPVAFSEQGDEVPLPAPPADQDIVLTLYLEPRLVRVDSTSDPQLANTQDVNVETCVRDRLLWDVKAIRQPDVPPPGTTPLAEVRRRKGTTRVEPNDIHDLRRTRLSLATTVDRVDAFEGQLQTLAEVIEGLRVQLDGIRRELDKLFWTATVTASTGWALFNGRVRISVKVTDRAGDPVSGAVVTFSTDFGVVQPALVSSGPDGIAAVDLVGVRNDIPIPPPHVTLLGGITNKVVAAMTGQTAEPTGIEPELPDLTIPKYEPVQVDPKPIQYRKITFEPEEMELVSRYSLQGELVDLVNEPTVSPVNSPPPVRVATVTIHVKDTAGPGLVKAVGNVQVQFGLWIRDWARTKILEMTESLSVGARVGDLIRQAVDTGEGGGIDHATLLDDLLPTTLQAMADDTHRAMKATVFGNPDLPDDDLRGGGRLGQMLVDEATAAIGAKTQNAVTTQLAHLVATEVVSPEVAADAELRLQQGSSQIVAGLAQSQRQRFAKVQG